MHIRELLGRYWEYFQQGTSYEINESRLQTTYIHVRLEFYITVKPCNLLPGYIAYHCPEDIEIFAC